MQKGSLSLILFVGLSYWIWVFAAVPRAEVESAAESECVKCHTDAKGLIRLGWEVEKIKGKPVSSAEIEGEG
jgi:hypothetical protein